MSTVAEILTAVGYKIFDNPAIQTITDDSQPSTSECIQWLNDGIDVLSKILYQYESSFGRTVGKFTTSKAVRITNITQANPAVVTTQDDHEFTTGDSIYLTGISGMIDLNNTSYTITVIDSTSFSLDGIDSSSYDEYTGNGIANPKKYYNDLASNMLGPAPWGVVYYEANAYKIERKSHRKILSYGPNDIGRPKYFYLDESGNIYLLPVPDDKYIIEIPYWIRQTQLTKTTDTVPFDGFFDRFLIEGVAEVYFNRNEYALTNEQLWRNFLLQRILNLIKRRDGVDNEVEC